MKIAIIGAGISGMSVAQLLNKDNNIKLFEKEDKPGGLIRCERINGSLYHICGGHVFNSKRQDVLNWFWNFFDRDNEFIKANRNSVVFMEDGLRIPYPIENHAYLFNEEMKKKFVQDLVLLAKCGNGEPTNFEEFLRGRFGETLYQAYFKPYNEKVWRRDLAKVPLLWLKGKLPMPTIEEMIYNNINHIEEKQFVHSSFWYERENGSQFIADRLAKGLNIEFTKEIKKITYKKGKWIIDKETFDKVIFCGNIKALPTLIGEDIDLSAFTSKINGLEYHGTTSVFCEIENNPYSWIYMPSRSHQSHRIICTGNFAKSNNAETKMTGSIEFTDKISLNDIKDNLKRIPLSPQYLAHHYSPCTYPIQDEKTREMIQNLKDLLSTHNFYFTGRFADWEYYNMDAAIGAAMDMLTQYMKSDITI